MHDDALLMLLGQLHACGGSIMTLIQAALFVSWVALIGGAVLRLGCAPRKVDKWAHLRHGTLPRR